MRDMKWVMIGVVVVAVVVCLAALRRSEEYRQRLSVRDRDFEVRVNEEKKKIAEDLDEKHRADRISYEAMSRRIDLLNKAARMTVNASR